MNRSICFIAGETSGDQNAAGVCAAVRRLAPDMQMFGAAGPRMQEAGCECVVDLTRFAVFGTVEVVIYLREFYRIFKSLLAEVDHRKPVAVVLTDYGGFNIRFAKALRKRGYRGKIIYFVSPQVWASRPTRAKTIAANCDLLLCIFAFEKDWYAQHAPALRVEFVGHPLVERLEAKKADMARDKDLFALLPGSRHGEIQRLWPPILVSAGLLTCEEALRFVAAVPTEDIALKLRKMALPIINERSRYKRADTFCSVKALKALTEESGDDTYQIPRRALDRVSYQWGRTHIALQQASLAIATSGTVTLECAFFGCPMIVVYRVAWPTYWIGRKLITVPWIAMPNILAGEKIVPEFIQDDANPQAIVSAVTDFLLHPEKLERQRVALAQVVKKLGPAGASERAAKAILNEL